MKSNTQTTIVLALTLFFSGIATASDINAGRDLYRRHCLQCHGANGAPNMAGAPDFSRGQGLMRSDKSLHQRIKTGRNACPGYFGILKDQEILDVVAYIRTLF